MRNSAWIAVPSVGVRGLVDDRVVAGMDQAVDRSHRQVARGMEAEQGTELRRNRNRAVAIDIFERADAAGRLCDAQLLFDAFLVGDVDKSTG